MDASFDGKTIRSVLKLWPDSRQLGQHPLARLAHVEAWRRRQGYSDSDAGRGLALRERLQEAVNSLRPTGLPPDPGQKAWRAYLILTEQFVNGRSPQWVAAQLHVSSSGSQVVSAPSISS